MFRKRFHEKFQPPFSARHVLPSALASLDDEPAKPSDRLIDLSLRAANRARTISLSEVTARIKTPPFYTDIWPGEHYRLLAAFIDELKPKTVVEIGTASGLSALAMLKYLPQDAKLYTFDILEWDKYPETHFLPTDFADGRMHQIIGDVAIPEVFNKHLPLLQETDFFFVDGPKDGIFERKFLNALSEVKLPKEPLLVFDDVRVWNMLDIWRHVSKPKLDITSFGHWSGTGIIHWTA